MNNIRKIIRKQLFKLLENYPAGTVNDPNAPWNKPEPKYVDIKKSEIDIFMPLYFNNEITVLKNKQDGSKWVFYNDSVEKNDYFPYSGAEDLSVFTGNDEDGQPTFDEEYGDWNLDGQIVADYLNDNLTHTEKGEGLEDYENGVGFVKINEPLASELVRMYKDDKLNKVLFA